MPSTEKSPEFYKHYPALFHTYEVSFEQYSSLADDKSAFGKIAIDSLWVQSNSQNKAVYEKLLLSHRYFSVGFQLYDDVKDFARDVRRGQFNWAVYQLQQKVLFVYYVLFKNPNSILHFPQNLYHFLKSLCNKDATISLVSFGELIVPMLFFYLLFCFLKGIFWQKLKLNL